jgi:hypothetical protein
VSDGDYSGVRGDGRWLGSLGTGLAFLGLSLATAILATVGFILHIVTTGFDI